MANLRAIKDRIKSITNTQKITKAMKMVAAAKVKKAENAVKLSRPFTNELHKMFSTAHSKICSSDYARINTKSYLENYPALLEQREVKSIGMIIISSNKGLAGAYNSNIVRFCIKKIKEFNEQGQKVKLYLAGTKTLAPLKAAGRHLDFEIVSVYQDVMNDISAPSALVIANELAKDYIEKKIDSIELVTTRYKNMMTYKVEEWQLLPALDPKSCPKAFHEDEEKPVYGQKGWAEAIMEFEPSVETVLSAIVPMYITNIIYQALLEAGASELAARMTAMSTATNNAQEMIERLTVVYNKKRQEKITDEIIEIVSGANALT